MQSFLMASHPSCESSWGALPKAIYRRPKKIHQLGWDPLPLGGWAPRTEKIRGLWDHGDRKSPISGVIPLINGLFIAYKWGLLTTY